MSVFVQASGRYFPSAQEAANALRANGYKPVRMDGSIVWKAVKGDTLIYAHTERLESGRVRVEFRGPWSSD